jgi:hypothetical protein
MDIKERDEVQTKGIDTILNKIMVVCVEDGNYRKEAESVLPKVKSWRDAGEHLAGKTTKKR